MASKFIYNDSANLAPYSFITAPNKYGINVTMVSATYQLTSVYLKLANYGTPAGNVLVDVYLLSFVGSSWQPVGDALASGSLPQANIDNYASVWSAPYTNVGALHEISLGVGTQLAPGHTYGIIFSATAGQLGVAFTAVMNSSPSAGYGPNVTASNFIFRNGTWQSFSTSFAIAQGWGTLYVPVIPPSPTDALPTFPPATRPDGYDPDDYWIPGQWDGDDYTPPEFGPPTEGRYFATGGGRWSQQLIAIGHGTVYYEALT